MAGKPRDKDFTTIKVATEKIKESQLFPLTQIKQNT